MLEKLNLNSLNSKKLLSTFELELFVELIGNYIQWEFILDILKIENDEDLIIQRIDKKSKNLMLESRKIIPKINRFDWILRKRLKQKNIDEYINKSFLYPVFLWLLSLNILTFMLIYILPSIVNSFSQLTNLNKTLEMLILIAQLLIGVEWGILLICIYFVITVKDKQILSIYKYLYRKIPNNIWVYYVSYIYLSDLLYLLNLNINIEDILNILKYSHSIINRDISINVKLCLKNGQSIKNSFDLIDLTFIKLIKIDDFERKFEKRLDNYLNVLHKQIEINIKKISNYFMLIVYVQIGLMVFLVYSVLLYPLKLIEGMNI